MKGLTFTFSIIAAVILTLIFPDPFIGMGDFKFKIFIIPLLQIIMFGMGSTMQISDFQEVLKSPKAVALGVFFQFSIMPLVGWGLTKVFSFPPEISAGIILVGCMPCGLASNVMSYLAKANVALSLTLTSIATFIAPLLTPLLMKNLAGQLIEIDLIAMIWEISKLILIPIVLGVIYNRIIGNKWAWFQEQLPLIVRPPRGPSVRARHQPQRDRESMVAPEKDLHEPTVGHRLHALPSDGWGQIV